MQYQGLTCKMRDMHTHMKLLAIQLPYNDDSNQTNTYIIAELPQNIIHHHSQK